MFIILLVFLVFIAWFHFEKSKAERLSEKEASNFWEDERKANTVRKKDISNLNYIKVPLSELTFQLPSNAGISAAENRLKNFSEKKILNLNHCTNTEIKLQYGVGNLDALSEYDQNYTDFIRFLQEYACLLHEEGYVSEAEKVLEYTVRCGSDIKSSYMLLADIYIKKGSEQQLDGLITSASNLPSIMKTSIINALNELREKCY